MGDVTKGLILIVALAGVVVLAAAGWQAFSEGEDVTPAQEEAAMQTQQASSKSEAGPADEGSASSPEDPAGTTQTKRLAVENILQVGGFGCASCQAVVAGTLQKSEGVEDVTYEPETDTYLVTVNGGFRMDEVAEQIRSVSEDYNRRLGLPDSPDWVLKEV